MSADSFVLKATFDWNSLFIPRIVLWRSSLAVQREMLNKQPSFQHVSNEDALSCPSLGVGLQSPLRIVHVREPTQVGISVSEFVYCIEMSCVRPSSQQT